MEEKTSSHLPTDLEDHLGQGKALEVARDSLNITSIDVLEVRYPRHLAIEKDFSYVGYGRDIVEARVHAGLSELGSDPEKVDIVSVVNEPEIDDRMSEFVCYEICKFHAYSDVDIPDEVRMILKEFMCRSLYASAVGFCFDIIWDRGLTDGDYVWPPDEFWMLKNSSDG